MYKFLLIPVKLQGKTRHSNLVHGTDMMHMLIKKRKLKI